jgi:hypothetical protein
MVTLNNNNKFLTEKLQRTLLVGGGNSIVGETWDIFFPLAFRSSV